MLKSFAAAWKSSTRITVFLALSAGIAYGQEYPSKPIRIMTSEVGGGTDIMARLLAQGISGPLGQPVEHEVAANESSASCY